MRIRPLRTLTTSLAALTVLAAGTVALTTGGLGSALAAPIAGHPAPPPIIQPGPVGFAPPSISSVDGSAGAKPGDVLKISGSAFGSDAGIACLRWSRVLVDNAFTHDGQLCLTIVDWQPARVIAQVPADVEGVPDELAELRLSQGGPDGQTSKPFSVQFLAAKQLVRVTNQAPYGQPLTFICSGAADQFNVCSPSGGQHRDNSAFSGASGTDSFTLRLANGWVFDHYTFALGAHHDGSASATSQLRGGFDTSGWVSVAWHLDSEFFGGPQEEDYDLGIWAYGPKGVPMQ